MRKIIFLRVDNQQVPASVLELCSQYTPLVEPTENGDLFLDLGCGPVGKILQDIARQSYVQTGRRAKIAMAGSKLLAFLAINRKTLPAAKRKKDAAYRCINSREAVVIQVLPGKEGQFLASLPLDEFSPLNSKEVKKLSRRGYYTVGEITAVPSSQLLAVLGKNTYLLAEQCRGIDRSPVLGLYPPLHIAYPLYLEGELRDFLLLKRIIKEAGLSLESILQQRHAGCTSLSLEMETEQGSLKKEQKTSQLCYQAATLANILVRLLEQLQPVESIREGRVILSGISPLSWEEQDLFAVPSYHQKEREYKLGNTLKNLNHKFPGKLINGQKVGRREEILSFWDPWRFDDNLELLS